MRLCKWHERLFMTWLLSSNSICSILFCIHSVQSKILAAILLQSCVTMPRSFLYHSIHQKNFDFFQDLLFISILSTFINISLQIYIASVLAILVYTIIFHDMIIPDLHCYFIRCALNFPWQFIFPSINVRPLLFFSRMIIYESSSVIVAVQQHLRL